MDKLDHLGWVVSASFAIGDVRFAIRSTSRVFGEWLVDVLGAYEVEDVEQFLYSIVMPEGASIRGSKEFSLLYKGSAAIVRTLDPVWLGRAFVAELESLRAHERDDAVYLSGSVTDMRGVPVLLPSGIAPRLVKLGRRASRIGVGLGGQLTTAVDIETAGVVPVRPTLDVPEDAVERLARILPSEGADGLRFVEQPEAMGAIVVPAREVDVLLDPARKGHALASLASQTLNLRAVGGRGLEALGRFVQATPCYGSSWIDPPAVLTDLAEVLRSSS